MQKGSKAVGKKLGLAGCGFISEFLMEGAKGAGLQIAAVCDIDETRAKWIAMPFGARAYTDYADLLADSDVDGIIVALPNHMHYEPIMQALDAGKHIFCEKPMTTKVAHSAAIVRKVAETGLVFQMGYMRRFSAAYKALKESLPRMAPLSAASVRLDLTYDINLDNPAMAATSWKNDIVLCGGGPLIHGGAHFIDVMLYLFGTPISVTGCVKRDNNGNEYATNLFFRMENGFCCHWQLCGTRAKGFGKHNAKWHETVDVTGVGGTALIESADWQQRIPPVGRITLDGEPGTKEILSCEKSAWAEELTAFVRGMEEGRCLGSTAVDGYRVDFILEELKKLENTQDIVLRFDYAY